MALLAAFAFGCATASLPTSFDEPRLLRIREVADEGDPQRRASTRLVLDGLALHEPEHAVSDYERAIRTDPTNPYAFLALAAYQVQWGDVSRGVETLEQARQLFDPELLVSPRVAPHFDGLRGRAMLRSGGDSGRALLARAASAAPSVWGDGWLSPEELR
jgi:hypothetical protein